MGLEGAGVARLRIQHEDYADERDWSWCDLTVRLPGGVAVPGVGETAELVLASIVESACPSELEGIYSCKLQPASFQPTFGFERAKGSTYSGLIERDDLEAGGDVVLHMGSGLTCYARFDEASDLDLSEIRHGEWWDLSLREPHEALWFEVVEPVEDEPKPDAAEQSGGGAAEAKGRGGLGAWFSGLARRFSGS